MSLVRAFIFSEVLLLSGCKQAEYLFLEVDCPKTSLVEDLETQMIFGEENSLPIARLKIEAVQVRCLKSKKVGEVALRLIISGIRFDELDRIPFQYFIAVMTPQGDILDKEIYSAFILFNQKKNRSVTEEFVNFIVSDALLKSGKDYRLLVGFQKKTFLFLSSRFIGRVH